MDEKNTSSIALEISKQLIVLSTAAMGLILSKTLEFQNEKIILSLFLYATITSLLSQMALYTDIKREKGSIFHIEYKKFIITSWVFFILAVSLSVVEVILT